VTGKGIIKMRVRDLKRLKVIHEVIERRITQRIASGIPGLSERQVRRIVKRGREGMGASCTRPGVSHRIGGSRRR